MHQRRVEDDGGLVLNTVTVAASLDISRKNGEVCPIGYCQRAAYLKISIVLWHPSPNGIARDLVFVKIDGRITGGGGGARSNSFLP